MKEVSKKEFFEAVDTWGKEGKDPMPRRLDDLWFCQKTNKLFGKIIRINCTLNEYYLEEV